MKYRTVIEIIAEAKNQDEALDIAGDFLKGEIESGIKWKYSTSPLKVNVLLYTAAFLMLTFIATGMASLKYLSQPKTMSRRTYAISAFKPSLKTSEAAGFKEAWDDKKE